jgi:hypothetical protein
MIAPLRPCSPACNGWRHARVLGVAVLQACPACWAREPLAPSHHYYQRQPQCRLTQAETPPVVKGTHELQ